MLSFHKICIMKSYNFNIFLYFHMSCTRLYDIIKTCVEVIDMIKKKLYILMLSLLITASLTPVSASEKTLQDDGTYHIVSVERGCDE